MELKIDSINASITEPIISDTSLSTCEQYAVNFFESLAIYVVNNNYSSKRYKETSK